MTKDESGRYLARTHFAALLRTRLTGDGQPVSKVYDYLIKDFGGASPVIAMASSKSWPKRFTGDHGFRREYYLQCIVFVLRGKADTNYVDGDGDTILDTIADGIIQVVARHGNTPYWHSIDFSQASLVVPVRVGGWDYWMETHYPMFMVT